MVVDSTDFKVHKLLNETEMAVSGPRSSNQLDKLQGLLKDKPKKRAMVVGGVNFNDIPALDVVKTSYDSAEANSKAFTAASTLPEYRIADDRFHIPVHHYDRARIQKLNGSDFE